MSKKIIILGIESSCDDTSAAIISDGYILSNIIANQKVHEKYGGVVPELASREHQKNIIPVVDTAIKEAGIKKEDISKLTEPFYRANSETNIKGFGIGLTIVKKVIESHHGQLTIASKYNFGSTFTIKIPYISEG